MTPTTPTEKSKYLISVGLDNTWDPVVTRVLSIPPDFTFSQVHQVLQIAFNRVTRHGHDFTVWTSDFKYAMMKSALCGPGAIKLQIVPNFIHMDMDGTGLKSVMEEDITLEQVYENPDFLGKAKITYEYDKGDAWGHVFSLLGRASLDMSTQLNAPNGLNVYCVGGEGHHVAEDCGSDLGWKAVKEAFKKGKRGDPDDRRDSYKYECLNGDEEKLDPYKWDIADINRRLGEEVLPECAEGGSW